MQEISQVYSWIIFDSLKKFQLTFLFQNFHSKATRINCLNNIYFVKLRFVCCFHCSLASLVTITHNLNIHILPSRILQDCMVKRDCGFICSLSLSPSLDYALMEANKFPYLFLHSFFHSRKKKLSAFTSSFVHEKKIRCLPACLPMDKWFNFLVTYFFCNIFFSLENK